MEVARENNTFHCRLTKSKTDILSETMDARGYWNNTFNVQLEEENTINQKLHTLLLSSKNEGKIKIFLMVSLYCHRCFTFQNIAVSCVQYPEAADEPSFAVTLTQHILYPLTFSDSVELLDALV